MTNNLPDTTNITTNTSQDIFTENRNEEEIDYNRTYNTDQTLNDLQGWHQNNEQNDGLETDYENNNPFIEQRIMEDEKEIKDIEARLAKTGNSLGDMDVATTSDTDPQFYKPKNVKNTLNDTRHLKRVAKYHMKNPKNEQSKNNGSNSLFGGY